MSICGEPDGRPTKYGVAIVDVCTGMLASQLDPRGAQCAPPHRQGPEGRGLALRNVAGDAGQRGANYLAAGRNGGRFGNGHPSIVPYTTYQAADAHDRARDRQRAPVRARRRGARPSRMGQGCALHQQPRAGREPLGDRRPDQRGACRTTRPTPGSPSSRRWAFPAAGSIRSQRRSTMPHTAARRMVETVEHPAIGALKMLGIPFKFSDTACSVRRAAADARPAHRGNPGRRARPR